MEALTYAVLALSLLALLVAMIFRTRRGTLIRDAVLGTLNVKGSCVEDTIEEDLEVLRPYFTSVRSSTDVPPSCDVLLLYCDINSSGELENSPKAFQEIIRDSGASLIVIATNNPTENYVAIQNLSLGSTNLLLTIDRRGERFARFLAKLFAQMHSGVSLGRAWVKIAPQIPGTEHPDLPTTICIFN